MINLSLTVKLVFLSNVVYTRPRKSGVWNSGATCTQHFKKDEEFVLHSLEMTPYISSGEHDISINHLEMGSYKLVVFFNRTMEFQDSYVLSGFRFNGPKRLFLKNTYLPLVKHDVYGVLHNNLYFIPLTNLVG